jgi:hypothetical protein
MRVQVHGRYQMHTVAKTRYRDELLAIVWVSVLINCVTLTRHLAAKRAFSYAENQMSCQICTPKSVLTWMCLSAIRHDHSGCVFESLRVVEMRGWSRVLRVRSLRCTGCILLAAKGVLIDLTVSSLLESLGLYIHRWAGIPCIC